MGERFTELYEKYADAVFRYCLLKVSDREKAVEITQETFTKYWDLLSKEKEITDDKALVFKIAHNLVIDWYRKKKPMSLEAFSEGNDDFGEEFVPMQDSAKLDIELETEARYLLKKVDDLPKSYRQAIYLKYVEGMDNAEIARVLGIKESAAAVRVHRGIEELKKMTDYKKLDE